MAGPEVARSDIYAKVSAVAAVVAVLVTVGIFLLNRDDGSSGQGAGGSVSTAPSTSGPSPSQTSGPAPTSTDGSPHPTGGIVAFASSGAGSTQAFVLDLTADRTTTVWSGGAAADPSVTPDGRTVAAVIEIDGRAVIAVGAADDASPRTFRVDGRPSGTAISPDGTRVAYVTDVGGDDDIAVLDLDSGRSEIVAGGSANETDPSWAFDGSRLVHVRDGSAGDAIVILPQVDGATGATIEPGGAVRSPWLAPDGRSVAFVGDVAGNREALVVALDGGGVENISESTAEETAVVPVGGGLLVTSAPGRGLELIGPDLQGGPVSLTGGQGDAL